MSSTQLDDGRVGSRIENYSGFWQKDLRKEDQVDSDIRLKNYTEVVNGVARYSLSRAVSSAHPHPLPCPIQATTTARRSSMSTVGPSRSTSRASTRARHSPRPSLATNTILLRRCPSAVGCVFSTLAVVLVALQER
jgi:hypothetical protein